jgi:hypothetical protein
MPPTFRFPGDDTELWRILTINPPARRGPFYTRAVARLKPDTTIADLRANLGIVAASMR